MRGFQGDLLKRDNVFHVFGTKHVGPEEYLNNVTLTPTLSPQGREGLFIPNTKQVHGADVHVVDQKWGGSLQYGDGWVTNLRDIACFVYTADCVPVLLCDPVNGVVGAVHCGWRSMAAGIASNAVEKMCGLGANRNDIRAAIGPSICGDCYEVGGELRETFAARGIDAVKYFRPHVQDKYMMHLTGICRELYIKAGLRSDNVEDLNMCTRCNPDFFVSYRRDVGTDDRQVSLIALI